MSRHISGQYDLELGAIRDQFMEMGGLVETQVNNAGMAFVTHDLPLADDVREAEKRLNQMEIDIDDDCIAIIARRQPAASDLRQVIGVMKGVTDLERIGDEANRIAKMAYEVSDQDIPGHQYGDLRAVHAQVLSMLNHSLDAFARLDVEVSKEVIEADSAVDDAYKALLKRCGEEMRSDPEQVNHLLSQVWVGRALERIGDHAKNMCEYVIFQVHGRDVRHQGPRVS